MALFMFEKSFLEYILGWLECIEYLLRLLTLYCVYLIYAQVWWLDLTQSFINHVSIQTAF